MTTNPHQNQGLALKAAMTTAENPWPLKLLTSNIRGYIDRMSEMWVEGQVVEYSPRGSTRMSFFTLRDVDEDVSMRVTAFGSAVADAGEGFAEGARVVVRVKPSFWEQRGSLSLQAKEIRLQGLGSLLAQIERLRAQLAKEGLFAAQRKRHRIRADPLARNHARQRPLPRPQAVQARGPEIKKTRIHPGIEKRAGAVARGA